MQSIFGNVLISAGAHGVLLVCCLAAPSQRLVPLFQGGDSALTLTALAVSAPRAEAVAHPAPNSRAPDAKPTSEMAESAGLQAAVGREPELGADEPEMDDPAPQAEDYAGDFPVAPAGRPADAAAPAEPPAPRGAEQPADADWLAKGVAGLASDAAGIRPYYPLGARLRGEEGTVKVQVCVGANGQVIECGVAKSSGYTSLDEAALKAVRRARFASARAHPLRAQNRTVLTFKFDLVD